MTISEIWDLLRKTYRAWTDDKVPTMGAALAYYSIFSLAPLVVIAIGVASLVFEEEAARAGIVREITNTAGPGTARAVEGLLASTSASGGGWWATILGFATLIFGASGVFLQLQESLNAIWKVTPRCDRGWLCVVRERFLSFTVALGTAFLLLMSLVVSAALAALNTALADVLPPMDVRLWQSVNAIVSFATITLLFAMIYKVLPDVKLAWRDVWLGAAVTSLLFAAGKHAIGLYLGQSGTASAFGAAGSLVVILVWVYYSSQILLFGAEFTRVYAAEKGHAVEPAANAEPTVRGRAASGRSVPAGA